jgi:hypothetical protein
MFTTGRPLSPLAVSLHTGTAPPTCSALSQVWQRCMQAILGVRWHTCSRCGRLYLAFSIRHCGCTTLRDCPACVVQPPKTSSPLVTSGLGFMTLSK